MDFLILSILVAGFLFLLSFVGILLSQNKGAKLPKNHLLFLVLLCLAFILILIGGYLHILEGYLAELIFSIGYSFNKLVVFPFLLAAAFACFFNMGIGLAALKKKIFDPKETKKNLEFFLRLLSPSLIAGIILFLYLALPRWI